MSDVMGPGRWGTHWVDDGHALRRAASDLGSGLLGVHMTATAVRSRWLGLRSAYEAPEAPMVWAAMDAPRTEAQSLFAIGGDVSDVLFAYADNLDVLAATWVEPDDVAWFTASAQAADRHCADALSALIAPRNRPTAWAPADPECGPTWEAPAAPHWDPLIGFVAEWGGFGPPKDRGETSRALYSLELSHAVGSGYVAWVHQIDFVSGTPPLVRDVAAAGQWSRAGTALDRVGVGLTFAQSGWKEWTASASSDTDERVGRSVTMGATTATGAWAGAKAGAVGGGLIGSAFGPGPGTVVGMIVGGTVGGFAGSYAGEYVGAHLVDYGGEVGDLVGDAYDTLTFWH